MKKASRTTVPIGPTTRCAIYTRKSTEEGLNQEFNSLDAQRDSGEKYVRSLAGEGWMVMPERNDDGGFAGGNIDRPALKRLMSNIEAGKVDALVVYKVDRLSRSLLDFTQLIQMFDKHNVSFVSVTQQFNTASSMDRLLLNVLLSFAQFEREIISERTRDKIAAARRKGKWAGSWPILGYDVDPQRFKLIVNPSEADRVRAIFQMYLKHESLMPVMLELEQLGWINKRWQTRKGGELGGKPFTRNSLYKLLTNIAYAGKVKYKDEVHDGERLATNLQRNKLGRCHSVFSLYNASMETRSQAVAIVQRAESEIRALLLRVAGEGNYEQVALLAEWAQRLRQITEPAGTAMRTPGELGGLNGQAAIRKDRQMAVPSGSRGIAPERRKTRRLAKSTAKKANYPRFHRDRDELVKIGWSKKQKSEYRHKASKAVVVSVSEVLQRRGAGGERFTFEELLPFRDPGSQAELPSYQTYLTLAWLRKENLIIQHGRQGYSLPPNINLMDALEERWKLLPKA